MPALIAWTGAAGRSIHEAWRHKGGQTTGPNPTDRARPGSKHHILVDADSIPLAVGVTAANRNDRKLLAPMLDAVVPVRSGRRGRPRSRPAKLHADKGYDHAFCRARGIQARIARRLIEAKGKPGRRRWVVERTLAWLARYRRLTVRYERRAAIHVAFLAIGCALICFGLLRRLKRRSNVKVSGGLRVEPQVRHHRPPPAL